MVCLDVIFSQFCFVQSPWLPEGGRERRQFNYNNTKLTLTGGFPGDRHYAEHSGDISPHSNPADKACSLGERTEAHRG